MKIKAVYEKKDDVPEAYIDLYEERDGKWILTHIDGIQTDANVKRLETALANEKRDHGKTKDRLKLYTAINDDPERLQEQVDSIPTLEAAAAGKMDDEKVAKLVDAQVRAKIVPIERERDKAKKEADEAKKENDTLKTDIKRGKIEMAVRKSAEKAGIVAEAIDDAVLIGDRIFDLDEAGNVVAKDNVGTVPGTSPDDWFIEAKQKKPHWFPANESGGAGGGGRNPAGNGKNPFSDADWNVTEQMALHRQDAKRAEALAKAAGTSVGGLRPTKKSA
jgi:hypothetical protein